jgi:hypothetical protein
VGASLRNRPHEDVVEANVRSALLRIDEELHAHEPAGRLVLRLGEALSVDEEAELHGLAVAHALGPQPVDGIRGAELEERRVLDQALELELLVTARVVGDGVLPVRRHAEEEALVARGQAGDPEEVGLQLDGLR